MKFDVKRESYRVVALKGQFDLVNAFDVEEQIELVLKHNHNLLVDLSEITYIDSIGVGRLVSGFQKAKEKELRFGLLNPSVEAKRVLKMAHLTQVIQFYTAMPENQLIPLRMEVLFTREKSEENDSTKDSAPTVFNSIARKLADVALELEESNISNAKIVREPDSVKVIFDGINFGLHNTNIEATFGESLDVVASVLKDKGSDTYVFVENHAGNTNTNRLEEDLPEERAVAVNNYLINAGVNSKLESSRTVVSSSAPPESGELNRCIKLIIRVLST